MASTIHQISRADLWDEQFIGSGTFGKVYSMTWNSPQLGRIKVAAKIINNNNRHELEIWAGLDHENIVKLIGVVDEGTEFMLILELCDGSLRSYLDTHKDTHLSLDDFYTWAEQPARALEYLHDRDLVHKDMKSKNIMVYKKEGVFILKLGDFGTAKNIQETIKNATQTASWAWMAPELMIKPYVLSKKYDIFALLVVVWELWTGKVPWEEFEVFALPYTICEKDKRLPIPEDCPEPIKVLMKTCWLKDWKQRPNINGVLEVITTRSAAFLASASEGIVDASWEKVAEIRNGGQDKLHSVTCMALSPEENLVVVDTVGLQIKKYSCGGQCMSTTNTVPKPYRIALSSENTCFMTNCSKTIRVYDLSDGELKDSWDSFCPNELPTPRVAGIALDHTGNLLLGDLENKCIYRHQQDGTYKDRMTIDIEPDRIAVTSQGNIVISPLHRSLPQIRSNDHDVDKPLHTIKHPKKSVKRTWDVCCAAGKIFVLWSLTNVTCIPEISCFTESAEYLGPIPLQGYKLAISLDGNTLFIKDSQNTELPVPIRVFTTSAVQQVSAKRKDLYQQNENKKARML